MKLIQVAQQAKDLRRATEFYTKLLGRPPVATFEPPGLAFFDLDGVRLLLDTGAPSTLIYLAVSDVRAAAEQLEKEGVHIVAGPHIIFSHPDGKLGPAGTDEWMMFILDSEGNTIALVSQLLPGA